jgi:hypothetical protein
MLPCVRMTFVVVYKYLFLLYMILFDFSTFRLKTESRAFAITIKIYFAFVPRPEADLHMR